MTFLRKIVPIGFMDLILLDIYKIGSKILGEVSVVKEEIENDK